MENLQADATGKPGPAPQDFEVAAYIQNMDLQRPNADWPEADLRDVVRYLHGSRLLRLPEEIKAVFPKRV